MSQAKSGDASQPKRGLDLTPTLAGEKLGRSAIAFEIGGTRNGESPWALHRHPIGNHWIIAWREDLRGGRGVSSFGYRYISDALPFEESRALGYHYVIELMVRHAWYFPTRSFQKWISRFLVRIYEPEIVLIVSLFAEHGDIIASIETSPTMSLRGRISLQNHSTNVDSDSRSIFINSRLFIFKIYWRTMEICLPKNFLIGSVGCARHRSPFIPIA
jgi:hypothetical protein